MKAFLDFIPLIAFFFIAKSHGVVMAAGALMAGMIAVSIIHFFMQGRKLEKQQWVILGITIVFCSLTLLLQDDIWVKWKTPIINWIFASVLLLSMLFKKQWLKTAGHKFITLTDKGWNTLTLVMVGYFATLGVLHYVFAFHFPEEVWIDFKVIWATVISFVFMASMLFALRNNLNLEEMQNQQDAKNKQNAEK